MLRSWTLSCLGLWANKSDASDFASDSTRLSHYYYVAGTFGPLRRSFSAIRPSCPSRGGLPTQRAHLVQREARRLLHAGKCCIFLPAKVSPSGLGTVLLLLAAKHHVTHPMIGWRRTEVACPDPHRKSSLRII
ncbi:hypothetical protein L210DRAFT_2353699 [Boletus edulis BED1]|uniref:Uncharacterized protein n=1 Tax=Boletus edulis BED1 TaxID=1328754 RepID=A0AAD4BQY5_BOLED|nr:hypothetical protein L210DRAFT_2353699 [Boletus edulis BED1]